MDSLTNGWKLSGSFAQTFRVLWYTMEIPYILEGVNVWSEFCFNFVGGN